MSSAVCPIVCTSCNSPVDNHDIGRLTQGCGAAVAPLFLMQFTNPPACGGKMISSAAWPSIYISGNCIVDNKAARWQNDFVSRLAQFLSLG